MILNPEQIEEERLLWMQFPHAETVTPKSVLRRLSEEPRRRVVPVPASSPEYQRLYRLALRADPERYQRYLERQRKKDRARYEREKSTRQPKPARVVVRGARRFKAERPKWKRWRAQQLDRQSWKCAMCTANLRKLAYHVDHIVPRASGGRTVESNLWILCAPCNQHKKAKRLFLL